MILLVIAVAWIVLCIFIIPSMKDKYMEIARMKMARNPMVTDEMMTRNLEMMRKAYVPMMIFFTALYTALAGFVFSLNGGAVARKHPDAMA